jgi:hypothetical protein
VFCSLFADVPRCADVQWSLWHDLLQPIRCKSSHPEVSLEVDKTFTQNPTIPLLNVGGLQNRKWNALFISMFFAFVIVEEFHKHLALDAAGIF